jgi:large subunit ribosomal protein L4
MKLSIKDQKGNAAGELDVKFEVIPNGRGTQAVHDTVVAFMAGNRRGTASTKTVGEVAGTNKKPWHQKGTGRARAGSFRSPLWRGGGVTHGPKPRDFSKKVNKKVAQLALRKALGERLKAGDVLVVDSLTLAAPKTKDFVAVVDSLGLAGGTALFVVAAPEKNVELASRNVVGVGLTTGKSVNTYEVLRYDKLVFTKDAFAQVEERLAK